MNISHDIIISRPVNEVAAYLSDIANDSVWQEDVLESAVTTAGPVGRGTAGFEVRSIIGFPLRTEWVVTAYEPEKWLCFESTTSAVPYEGVMEFSPVEGGTRLTYAFSTKTEGIAALFDPLMELVFGFRFRANLDNLKRILETT
ncbi:MAG: SRPBCC family protein [Chlorobium sp.]|uniref:SRPBCC family protein n=1 Tax=Chlorobium sp. TaxID=1095 RepID=UPI001D590221|nr:SRPBCC family protein [Chlorobium sp.]MBN1278755.1 SRPBCC family protein [Chlorobiaceae bacterium]MCF8215594.1 SRPBCC family protein [Chlorobium sp.]MCF8270352.1 SRPBCC family protein [Chlorobium sp.]MCF8286721.1 SRPBCC family protein [Chlorobium sp.]MCF8290243.1 SRPBCC family protein [Chlorobium sp.]